MVERLGPQVQNQNETVKAIQLVSIDEKTSKWVEVRSLDMFSILPQARKWLNKQKAALALVSFTGPKRIGKSTFVNQLTGQLGGFEVSGDSNSKTKGLWVLPKTFIGKTEKNEDV